MNVKTSWFLFSTVIFVLYVFAYAKKQYTIICDAGSTGTRVKVFSYIKGRHNPIDVTDVKQVNVPKPDKSKPGLSEFANNIDGIGKYLETLLASAKKSIPAESYASTPIHLLATAGMRLLNEKQKEAILNEVDRLFSDKSFCPFHYEKGFAKIVSGEEEAVYGWVTLNFIKGTFSSKERQQSYGTLDLGGASTQNAFGINTHRPIKPTMVLTIGGRTYPVYGHSYLGDGANEATRSYLEYLIKKRKHGKRKLVSPCHNKGYKKTLLIKDKSYILLGKYNKDKCSRYVRDIFFCDKPLLNQCPFWYQPTLKGIFYGYSAFYYALNDAGVLKSEDQIISLNDIRIAAQKVCLKPADKLDTKLYDVYGLCFRLRYIYELLKDGYEVKKNSFTLHIAKTLKGFQMEWSLGAMLLVSKLL